MSSRTYRGPGEWAIECFRDGIILRDGPLMSTGQELWEIGGVHSAKTIPVRICKRLKDGSIMWDHRVNQYWDYAKGILS